MEINYSAHVLSLPLDPVFRVMQTATAEKIRQIPDNQGIL